VNERHRDALGEANAVRPGPYGPSRPRQSIDAAVRDARQALAELLATGPPWVDDPAGRRFRQLQEGVDAGMAFATVWKPLAPEITLVRLCVGPAARRRAGCPTMGVPREAQLARFVAVYARPPAPLDPRALFAGPRSADLGRLPAVVEAAVGARARLRDDASRPLASEVRWLLLRSTLAPERPSAVLDSLVGRASAPDADPLVVAAVAYARMLIARPFWKGNEAAALLSVDEILRATPGLSAARIGLATRLQARRRTIRAALTRVAHRRGDGWTPWTLAFLTELAAAARGTVERAGAYRAACDAVHERLTGPAGERILGAYRVDPRELARLAAANPYLSAAAIVQEGLALERTARRYLDAITRLGLGRRERQGRLRLVRMSALADAVEHRDPTGTKRVQLTEPPRHRA
jgi:hypothetical protein